MPCPSLICSQSDYLIQNVDINSNTEWQTVQIPISWPTDLDLHCLQKQGISGFSRTRVNKPPLKHLQHLLFCLKYQQTPIFKITDSSEFKTEELILMLSTLGKIFNRQHFKIFCLLFLENRI